MPRSAEALCFHKNLFKNAVALETAARIQAVVMDKTGTLTKGEPEVVEVVNGKLADSELLRLAAAVEKESEHPLAQAIVKRAAGSATVRPAAGHTQYASGSVTLSATELAVAPGSTTTTTATGYNGGHPGRRLRRAAPSVPGGVLRSGAVL